MQNVCGHTLHLLHLLTFLINKEKNVAKWFKAQSLKAKLSSNFTALRGSWMAQLVKHPIHDLRSGLDVRVVSWTPALGSTLFNKKNFNALTYLAT